MPTITRPSRATGSRTIAALMPATPNERAASGLGEADSGIQVAIEHIHHDVEQYEQDRDREHSCLHERVVALDDRRQEHAADPGDREDLLDDDRATQKLADLDPEQRHDADQTVLQNVPPD